MLRRRVLRGLAPLVSSSSSSSLGNAACISTTAAQQESLAVAADAKTGGGFLSKLFGGGSNRLAVPMSDPLSGITIPSPAAPPAVKPGTLMTTLPNGVRIASEATVVSGQQDTELVAECSENFAAWGAQCPLACALNPPYARLLLQGPTVSLGLYVDAGSIYESPETTGKRIKRAWAVGSALCLEARPSWCCSVSSPTTAERVPTRGHEIATNLHHPQACRTSWSMWLSSPQPTARTSGLCARCAVQRRREGAEFPFLHPRRLCDVTEVRKSILFRDRCSPVCMLAAVC